MMITIDKHERTLSGVLIAQILIIYMDIQDTYTFCNFVKRTDTEHHTVSTRSAETAPDWIDIRDSLKKTASHLDEYLELLQYIK